MGFDSKEIISYNELSDDEKAALKYYMVYFSSISAKKDHPELFGTSFWNNSFYRRLTRGEDSLKRAGILDKNRNPTDLAYHMLPTDTLREMLKELREESIRIETRKVEFEEKCRDLQKMEKYKLISEIADKFSFLGVDENWIVVLISTNLVEQAMKKKLEDLGIPLKAEKGKRLHFGEIVQILGTVLKEKENRRLKALISPNELYDVRSKIVHAGYKRKFSHEEAQAIFVLVKNIVDDLWH